VDREQLPDLEQRDQVISTHLAAGRTVVHVYSEAHPGDGFEPVQASLEDVYFTTLEWAAEEPLAA